MKLRIILFALFLALPSLATSETLSIKSGEIDFIAIGRPSALKVHGHGTDINGNFILESAHVKGTIWFALASLDTGIDLRNHHMKEKYLKIAKFPIAQLRLENFILPSSPLAPGFKGAAPFEGALSLHGATKTVHGMAEVSNSNGGIDCNAQFKVKISDYSIDVPRYLGITVADDVQVTAKIKTVPTR